MSIDKYLDREYDFQSNNCCHFVSMVWKDLTGENITELCNSYVARDLSACRDANRQKLRVPKSPCICLLQSAILQPHAGIFIDDGILHLSETGARHDNPATLKPYYRLSYYA